MKKNDQIVAELNQSVPRIQRFCYDIEPEDVVTLARVTRSDKPDFHVQYIYYKIVHGVQIKKKKIVKRK